MTQISVYGFSGFVSFFTNWSWNIQTILYVTTLPAFNGRYAYVAAAAVSVFYTLTVTIVFSVALLVVAMLVDDPVFITRLFKVIPTGIVITGNEVKHFAPLLVIVVFTWLRRSLVWYGLKKPLVVASRSKCPALARIAIIVYYVFIGPLLVIVPYLIVYDPANVYETEVSMSAGAAVVLFTMVTIVGIPLVVAYASYGLFDDFDDELAEYERIFLTETEKRRDGATITLAHDQRRLPVHFSFNQSALSAHQHYHAR